MNKKLIPLALLLTAGMTAGAQTREKAPAKEKEESITIRKKSDSKEKTTIVIDGDEITVNGKPLSELKDGDVEVMRNRRPGPEARVFGRLSPMPGGVKMFADGFPLGNKAVLGVSTRKDDKGARIVSVEKESAAEQAGLKQDDIITKVGDNVIEDSDALYEAVGKLNPDDKVSITYLRDGKEASATTTLKKNSNGSRTFRFNSEEVVPGFRFNMPDLRGLEELRGLEGMDFSGMRKPKLGMTIQDLAEGKGVKITDIDDASAADKAGLKKDDVITTIDGKAVTTVDELKDAIRNLKEGDTIKITYLRDGKSQSATLGFPKKLKMAEL